MSRSLILAWLVHLYTALGTVVAFFSLLCIEQTNFRDAFYLMALAVVIDATDGTLARAARVKELIPWFDGELLDEIVDYFNYVIVPSLFLVRANVLPPQDALWLAALPLLSSAYGFCQREAKTADYFFRGFPSYWNVVVFYLYVLQTPLWVNAFVIIALSILVFVPIKYIYPSRSPRFRSQINVMGALWGAAMLCLIYQLPNPSRVLLFASLLFPAYYTALSLWLEYRRAVSSTKG
ncbi:MAG TPA: CDP-alcohol phosphatidyltransferase family protein [Candidatus Binatia bacterium]|jgi:phosphatidylcholine synthase|nr:CDP-alcohol phosphatidyltransferase family protein [Candidatus Binatia bacterium]